MFSRLTTGPGPLPLMARSGQGNDLLGNSTCNLVHLLGRKRPYTKQYQKETQSLKNQCRLKGTFKLTFFKERKRRQFLSQPLQLKGRARRQSNQGHNHPNSEERNKKPPPRNSSTQDKEGHCHLCFVHLHVAQPKPRTTDCSQTEYHIFNIQIS